MIPSNNPDGSHYSMYDSALQRRNMTNHCGEAQSDPGYRNSWGVDLNRGYSVASRRDGFDGASGTCTSDTYDGPAELTEPEVLYSSTGNVREELYVNHGVYAFGWEVGGATWDTTTRQFQSGSFQPSWSQAQGEYME